MMIPDQDLRLTRKEGWLRRRWNEYGGDFRYLPFQERCKHRKSYWSGGAINHPPGHEMEIFNGKPTRTCPRCGSTDIVMFF